MELNGQVTVYDTLNHSIGGVSQQQGGDTSLNFSSQFGTVSVGSLPIVSGAGLPPAAQTHFAVPSPINTQPPQNPEPYAASPAQSATPLPSSTDDMIVLIEKLARLRDAGALTDDEFNAKKGELLSRI